MAEAGWMGLVRQVEHYLEVVGADKDKDGNFELWSNGSNGPSTFMGAGVEIVIPGDVSYLKNGNYVNLCAGLRETSYGLSVVVI